MLIISKKISKFGIIFLKISRYFTILWKSELFLKYFSVSGIRHFCNSSDSASSRGDPLEALADPFALIGEMIGTQEVRVRIQPREGTNSPKLWLDASLQSLSLFLSPSQVHSVIEMINALSVQSHSARPSQLEFKIVWGATIDFWPNCDFWRKCWVLVNIWQTFHVNFEKKPLKCLNGNFSFLT